eukprot:219660_1
MDAQRELLDALMGKGRNRSKEDAPLEEQHWDDSDVCPYFICAFCPNDLFVNTKSDLGQCEYFHLEELRTEYEKQPRRVKRRLEKKLLQYLYELVSDVDRRIRRGKERIALNAPSTQPNPIIEQQIEQKKKSIELRCNQLDAEINKLKEHIEILCNEGKIDDAEAMLKQVETLENDKDNLQNMDVNHVGIKDPRSDKNRFQICEICGVFQAVDDAEDRIARHFEGKQHKGFAIIREKIKELEALHIKEMNEINDRNMKNGGGRDRRDRNRNRNRGNDRRRGMDRDMNRDRKRDKGRRNDHRDRDRDRERWRDKERRSKRYRSSSSSKRRDRDRKRDRDDGERKRDRKRDKDRDKNRRRRNKHKSVSRSRSRSREERSKSRSKDKKDEKMVKEMDKDGDVVMNKHENGHKEIEVEEGETK